VLLPGFISAAAMALTPGVRPLWEWVLPLSLTAVSALFVGRLLELLLHRRYFADAPKYHADDGGEGRMSSLHGRGVEHVFCATDLVLGQPLYFSSHNEGIIWRRTETLFVGGPLAVLSQLWQARTLRIAEVVRASASFPGIPPKRLSFGRWSGRTRLDPRPKLSFGGTVQEPDEPPQPAVAFLGDGGLWNNLGSHVVREDRFLRGGRAGVPSLLCINASAQPPKSSLVAYHIPGWALLHALIAGIQVLNTNTVQPRVHSMQQAQFRRVRTGVRPNALDPLDLIVDLSSSSAHLVSQMSQHRDDIRRTDPAVAKWRSKLIKVVQKWGYELGDPLDPTEEEARSLAFNAIRMLHDEPQGEMVTRGAIDYDSLDDLREKLGKSLDDADVDSTPTTLGRVLPEAALRLLLRGYFNTYVQSSFLKPFAHEEGLSPRVVEKRIRAMVEAAAVRATAQPDALRTGHRKDRD
jgi:hypothetical protein